eukprot:gnl/TRDRNA2_/TRDRNA2_178436_c0_seq1.p2 gnl/TRDRNA2_/TRDRNA2_178436_c0~~gnl/TRDRNA2_/TRDRNA2_178436_c0_seq1.p2  ORF type:complete len:234 (-),score=54.53 gnl/TRDRNA2_/TRDRNA2_178436_c0_seq1:63-764(-)
MQPSFFLLALLLLAPTEGTQVVLDRDAEPGPHPSLRATAASWLQKTEEVLTSTLRKAEDGMTRMFHHEQETPSRRYFGPVSIILLFTIVGLMLLCAAYSAYHEIEVRHTLERLKSLGYRFRTGLLEEEKESESLAAARKGSTEGEPQSSPMEVLRHAWDSQVLRFKSWGQKGPHEAQAMPQAAASEPEAPAEEAPPAVAEPVFSGEEVQASTPKVEPPPKEPLPATTEVETAK